MKKATAALLLFVVAIGAGSAIAATAALKCQDKTQKNIGKLGKCLTKCHIGRVRGKLTDQTAEDACETSNGGKSCLEKFAAAQAKLSGCPTCIDPTIIAQRMERLIDSGNSLPYCGSGTPWGGDDKGNIPSDAPDGPVTRCANLLAAIMGKDFGSMGKCHVLRANGKLPDQQAEDQCEIERGNKNAQKVFVINGCDPCVYGPSGATPAILYYVQKALDDLKLAVYCDAPAPCGFSGDDCSAGTCCGNQMCELGACCVPHLDFQAPQCLDDADCCADSGRCHGGVCRTNAGDPCLGGNTCDFGFQCNMSPPTPTCCIPAGSEIDCDTSADCCTGVCQLVAVPDEKECVSTSTTPTSTTTSTT